MRAKYGTRQVVNIDELQLDPEDYEKYKNHRIVISKNKVVIIFGYQDYNFLNIIMDQEFIRFIHKDGNIFNFKKENIIRKYKNPKAKRICPDCKIEELKPHYRYCTECGLKRKKELSLKFGKEYNNKYQKKYYQDNKEKKCRIAREKYAKNKKGAIK